MGLNDNGPSIPRIQVFRPTMEEMKDFEGYINKIEKSGAHKAGLAKIIPPPEWKPRRLDSDYQSDQIDQLVIKAPIQQIVQGRLGLYQQYNIQKKSLTVKEFKKLAESPRYRTPDYFDYEELERKYWKNVAYNPPIYGADVPGSLYDEDVDEFNINRLDTILDLVNESYGIKIMGVNTAYLYFGMWKTTFAWHTEDMDLYSINYLHFGAPKSWYCVPPEHGKRLERLAAGFFPNSVTSCPAFLRHKMTLISPHVLKQYSIPFNKITQEAGEFMITFPYSYHAGYNHGYNCAESTNFATERWVEYGKRATRCNCRSDSVKISMEAFIKKYQPDRYELWLQGKDIGPHPEDPSHISPAPLPSDYELQVLSKVSKSKRHPPYKPESEISDTESMENGCEMLTHFPTKAARKHFETPSPSSSLSSPSKLGVVGSTITVSETEYLKTSPPDIKDAVKRIRNRYASRGGSTKRSRKNSINSESNSDLDHPTTSTSNSLGKLTANNEPAKSLCTQSAEGLIPLTWVSKASSDPGALQLIDRFLNCDLKSYNDNNNSVNDVSSDFKPVRIKQEKTNNSVKNLANGNLSTMPPPLMFTGDSNHLGQYEDISSGPSSHQSSSRSQYLPPLPPLQHNNNYSQLTSILSKRLNGSHTHLESSYENKQESNIELSEASIELPSSQSHSTAEAGTSTEDLLVNDIILKSRTFHSDDLSKLLADETLSHDLREILKRVPVQPYLYQHLPYNFFGEQIFNCSMSSIYPHCSICIVMQKFEIKDDWVDAQSKIPTSSPIMIPNAAFAFKVDDATTNLEEVKVSPLLVCTDCKICVHSICYGVVNKVDPDNRASWKCDRCINKDYGVHCYLCPLRGGALKKTKDENRWTHITCALMQPGVTFKNGINKQPIDLTGIKKTRANCPSFKCIYCQKTNNKLADYINGFCIQCYMAPKCSAKFHTTCAHLNGAKFEMDDWPDPIRVYCTKCIDKTSYKEHLNNISTEDEVDISTVVLAKHKNGRYYDATVFNKTRIILHHAHLDDNSFLQVLRSSDIINPDIEQTGIPEVGDPITVYWDKINQSGKYAGNHTTIQYHLKFEDGSIVKSTRENFYRFEEEIPAKVQAKRSRATDVKNDNSFWQQNLKILTAAQ